MKNNKQKPRTVNKPKTDLEDFSTISSQEGSLTFVIKNDTYNQQNTSLLDIKEAIKKLSKCSTELQEEDEINAINQLQAGGYFIESIKYLVGESPFDPHEQFSEGGILVYRRMGIGRSQTFPIRPMSYRKASDSIKNQIGIILNTPIEYERGMHFILSVLPKTTVCIVFSYKKSAKEEQNKLRAGFI
jgi:hypothetical protein